MSSSQNISGREVHHNRISARLDATQWTNPCQISPSKTQWIIHTICPRSDATRWLISPSDYSSRSVHSSSTYDLWNHPTQMILYLHKTPCAHTKKCDIIHYWDVCDTRLTRDNSRSCPMPLSEAHSTSCLGILHPPICGIIMTPWRSCGLFASGVAMGLDMELYMEFQMYWTW